MTLHSPSWVSGREKKTVI